MAAPASTRPRGACFAGSGPGETARYETAIYRPRRVCRGGGRDGGACACAKFHAVNLPSGARGRSCRAKSCTTESGAAGRHGRRNVFATHDEPEQHDHDNAGRHDAGNSTGHLNHDDHANDADDSLEPQHETRRLVRPNAKIPNGGDDCGANCKHRRHDHCLPKSSDVRRSNRLGNARHL